MHLTFVELEKAYDTVSLRKLWTCMEKSGVSNPSRERYSAGRLYSYKGIFVSILNRPKMLNKNCYP